MTVDIRCIGDKKVEAGIEGTLVYMDSPYPHWPELRTIIVIALTGRSGETRVVGAVIDGNSALMLVCATSQAWPGVLGAT